MIFDWFRRSPARPEEEEASPLSATVERRYRAGDNIGGVYRVLKVNEGGLGVVYVVQHASGDQLALKTLKDQGAINSAFHREAETWVQLGAHPNIVQAHWVNDIAGITFVGAELINADEHGRVSLRDYLKFGPLTSTLIVRCSAHFCYGMSHAYSRGLQSHRDIKPENLLIGDDEQLKITDFGISTVATYKFRSLESDPSFGRWRTQDREISGTPAYMAPEQITGALQDHRADIYAFGTVLYEMCYGRLPFLGRTVMDLFQQHIRSTPNVPNGPFAEIIKRCLAKTPDDRFQNPLDLLSALHRNCKELGLTVPPEAALPDARYRELRAHAHSLAEIGKTDQALAAAKDLVKLYPTDPSGWTQLGRLLTERGSRADAIQATKRALELDATRSAPWNNLGVLYCRDGRWKDACAALDRALACDPQNTGAMLNSTDPLRRLGRAGEALIRLRRAAEIAPDKYSIWTNLGSIYLSAKDRHNALLCLNKALGLAPTGRRYEIQQAIRDAEQLGNATSVEALIFQGRFDDAIALLNRRVAEAPQDRDAWHNLGLCRLNKLEYDNAQTCFRRVYEIDNSDGFAVCRLIELAAIAKDLEDVDKWCEILRALPNGQMSAIAYKARALSQCNEHQEAKQLILRAVKTHPNQLELLVACGDVMMWHPNIEAAMNNAVAAYQRAVTILKHKNNDSDRLQEIESRLLRAKANLGACRSNGG